MYSFDYSAATTVGQAAAAFRDAMADQTDPQYLAGGQTKLPTMKAQLAAPGVIIDLNRIPDLRRIAVDGRRIEIGAMVRHAEAATSADIRRVCPALADLAQGIGDPQVRNRGTLGGSVANNDPAADYPAPVFAMSGVVHKQMLDGQRPRYRRRIF